MTYKQYVPTKELACEHEFETLLMAAMRKAEMEEKIKLQKAFPEVFGELVRRIKSLNGRIDEDDQ